MQQAGASSHLQAVVHSMYFGLWWPLCGHDKPAKPQRGFCPGAGVVDLAFTLVFRLFFSSLKDRLWHLFIGIVLQSKDPLFAQSGNVES